MLFNKNMDKMLKQLGMNMKDVDAEEVIIRRSDGSEIRISEPEVAEVTMQGQRTFQVSGNIEEVSAALKPEDVQMIMEQTGATYAEAESALKETKGDIADAIMRLKK